MDYRSHNCNKQKFTNPSSQGQEAKGVRCVLVTLSCVKFEVTRGFRRQGWCLQAQPTQMASGSYLGCVLCSVCPSLSMSNATPHLTALPPE